VPGQPTAATEFRRGLDADNLRIGALAAAALGVATWLATAAGAAPDLLGRGAGPQAVVAALALFVLITALHTTAHTYFGWRFARGLRAAAAGDHRRALGLLAPVERSGMSHYDPEGSVRRALDACRAALAGSR
jgi:hypothetical protein